MNARTVSQFTARLVATAFVALLATACEHSPAATGVVASITVERNPDTLAVLTSRQFRAIGRDANGNTVAINPTWSVVQSGGAINANGVFTAGTVVGSFANTVKAAVGSISGLGTVVVTSGLGASVVVTPNPVTLAIGATQQFTAVFKDAGGNIITNATPVWSVASGGTISSTGLFTAGTTAGTFNNTVVASIGQLAGSATVIVTPGTLASITVTPNPKLLAIGATQLFTAVGKDVNGNVVALTPAWAVMASGGTIDQTGLFTAGTLSGTFANTVRACSTTACATGAISGFATVSVGVGALANITVTPNPVDVGTNARQQFTAVGTDASGNIIAILPTWSMQAGLAGGTVLAGGGYLAPPAVGVGIDTVIATLGTISGKARINVKASSALVSLSVTPNPANVGTGGIVNFTATGFDGAGLVVPTPGLAWSVVASGGTINGTTGQFTAGSTIGTFANTVKATSGTIFGYATVNVSTPPPPPGGLLGAAATHGILAGTAVSCAGAPGIIAADVSVWPGSAINGFPPCVITGARHAADAFAMTAQGDLTTAYLALAAMPCGTNFPGIPDLGGTTLTPGVYCAGSSIGVTGAVTLSGPAGSVFVIRAGSSLTTAGSVVFIGGASAKDVYWWTGSSATLGSGSAWAGNILSLTSITLVDGVNLSGRALARNGAVSLGVGSFITLP